MCLINCFTMIWELERLKCSFLVGTSCSVLAFFSVRQRCTLQPVICTCETQTSKPVRQRKHAPASNLYTNLIASQTKASELYMWDTNITSQTKDACSTQYFLLFCFYMWDTNLITSQKMHIPPSNLYMWDTNITSQTKDARSTKGFKLVHVECLPGTMWWVTRTSTLLRSHMVRYCCDWSYIPLFPEPSVHIHTSVSRALSAHTYLCFQGPPSVQCLVR